MQNQDDEWHGNVHIPINERILSSSHSRALLGGKSVAVFGDSLGRRTTATWAHFLFDADEGENNAELGLGGHGHFDWVAHAVALGRKRTSLGLTAMTFTWTLSVTESLVQCNIHLKAKKVFNIVTMSLGLHDSMPAGASRLSFFATHKKPRQMAETTKQLLQCLAKITKSVIVWRTAPYSDKNKKQSQALYEAERLRIDAMNALAIKTGGDVCPDKFRVAHAARALASRTLGKLRIAADTANHFGHTGRFVVVQTIMNAIACSMEER